MADRRIPWLLVFPTHVGVYLDVENYLRPAQCFPHTRGGVPDVNREHRINQKFSPHTWGCTCAARPERPHPQVFPTHVGVYRAWPYLTPGASSFPHTRGGVPSWPDLASFTTAFSPHTWGCTFNNGNIGLVISCFPHTRGGVPVNWVRLIGVIVVFPTHVGVYLYHRGRGRCDHVFPTHVGVYLQVAG